VTIGGIITAIIFGAIIGALGRLIVPGKQSMPIWLTIVVGIAAAFLGTAMAHWFGLKTHGFNFWETIFQVALAVVFVFAIARFWPEKSTRAT
jgi:uncharacterized membrane protein YeaQ/YmgE (transglycosylase-associated protein family)